MPELKSMSVRLHDAFVAFLQHLVSALISVSRFDLRSDCNSLAHLADGHLSELGVPMPDSRNKNGDLCRRGGPRVALRSTPLSGARPMASLVLCL